MPIPRSFQVMQADKMPLPYPSRRGVSPARGGSFTWLVTARPMDRNDVLRMVKRRLLSAGVPSVFSNHSFRATGITEFLANGGSLETAQELANHADSRTTRLYVRRATRMELEEIVRIRY